MQNWYDISIIVVLLVSTLLSIFRGFSRECLTLVTWIGGACLAYLFAPLVGSMVPGVSTVLVRNIISGFIIFLTIVILGSYLSNFLRKVISSSSLSIADRGLGAVFGISRAAVVSLLLTAWLATTSFTEYTTWQSSVIAPKLQHYSEEVGQNLPGSWQQKLSEWSLILHF